MSISVRTRFEVFKRDRFTCTYCGRTPPEVLLEADHVVPRAAGGSDDITNLTTACATCNRGKAARLLEEGTAPVVGRATVEELAERVEQAKAYMELLGQSGAITDNQVSMVIDHWAKLFGAKAEEREDGTYWVFADAPYEAWPKRPSIRRVLRSLPLEDVLHAADIAAAKMNGLPGSNATRYFFGVCQRAIREGSPVGPRRSPENDPQESYDAGYEAGFGHGIEAENRRIRDFLAHHTENGFPTILDAAIALWPED